MQIILDFDWDDKKIPLISKNMGFLFSRRYLHSMTRRV